jgi:hypothetical protein
MTFDNFIELMIKMDNKYKKSISEYVYPFGNHFYLDLKYYIDIPYPLLLISSLIGTKFYLNYDDVDFLRVDAIYFYENEMISSLTKFKQDIVEPNTYLMLDKKTKLIKIGKSIKPLYREKTLQSERPIIELLFYINLNVESKLHKKYSQFRIRGEWFKLSDNDLLDIYIEYKENIIPAKHNKRLESAIKTDKLRLSK